MPTGAETDLTTDPFVAALPENAPFWEAAERGVLLLKHCKACDRPHWYPRIVCPLCGSDDVEWREASGRGAIYSFSVVRRMGEPYVLAFVTLEEGPTVMTNIVDTPEQALEIGARVRVVFRRTAEGRKMPYYTA
jgi:uncharacterized OB-fold protein